MHTICSMFENGTSIKDLAKEFNKTEREIKIILHYGLR